MCFVLYGSANNLQNKLSDYRTRLYGHEIRIRVSAQMLRSFVSTGLAAGVRVMETNEILRVIVMFLISGWIFFRIGVLLSGSWKR